MSARCSRSVRNSIPDRIVTLPAKFAYLLFTGSRVVLVRALSADAEIYPQMEEFRAVHEAIASASKISPFPICSDGRLRLGRREQGNHRLGLDGERTDSVGFGAYRAKTDRNQPRAADFLPCAASWWRTLVTPEPGKAIGYFDYKSQEFGLAAYLYGDRPMIEDLLSGEVYIPLGVRSGLIPPGATKETHGEFRDKVLKPVLLGLQYGRQPAGIALAIGGGNPATYRQNLAVADVFNGNTRSLTARFGMGRMPTSKTLI